METWKDVKGYEGYYKISSNGKLVSLHKGTIKELSNKKGKDGYIRFYLCLNSKVKNILAHRLIALTFIPNPENKPQINHINGIKHDNRVENLEWVTASENIKHSYDTGLICRIGSKSGAKITEDTVLEIRSLKGFNIKDISEMYGIKYMNAWDIINRRTWADI